jgi:hypothetical protein
MGGGSLKGSRMSVEGLRDVSVCQCKSGCNSRRCACLKTGKSCTKERQCHQCQNPLNGLDVEDFPRCLPQNIQAYQALSQAQ